MKSEVILMVILGFGALIIVVIDDWWKRRLVDKARSQRKTIRKDLLDNKTQWTMVVVLAVGLALFAFIMSKPELVDRDFGPLNPIIQWLFENPQ